jgi:RNA polymerase sigma-70 factor (ECF subfamily)
MKREVQLDGQAPPEKDGDRSLLRRVADRDREALTELYRRYHARLFKFVYRLTGSYTIADELETEVMLAVWDKAPAFRGDSKVSTWIFGIAYKMAFRRLKRERLQPLQPAAGDWLEEVPADSGAGIETEDWVRRGLLSLPPAHRITVTLVFWLGLTYEETAVVTGCPVNTVKTRMFHARRKLKELLENSALPVSSTKNRDHA